jgi:TPR repeat protein
MIYAAPMDFNEEKSLIDEARRRHREGHADEAFRLLNVAADAGSIGAMVELAHMERAAGKKAESDKWIDRAEVELQPGDLDGHITLNGAYSLGLGRGEREFLERRALYHLEQVAMAGNAVAQERLALDHLHGLNGCERDYAEFERWIGEAIKAGSSRAVFIYVESLFRAKRPIPPPLLSKLAESQRDNKVAAKLLRAIDDSRKKSR